MATRIALSIVPLLLCLMVPVAWPALAETPNFDPATGYRIQYYRAPITRPPEGGKRIGLAELDALVKQGALLIDVMPARAGYEPKTGKWRLVETRKDIPGSTWLPDVGHGRLEPRLAAYFADALTRLTGGKRDKPLVFYCLADCWMSWNAVKRAASLGHSQVYWFAEGTDGWAEAGRELVEGKPLPVPHLPETAPDAE